jgi:hypothetical protein
VGLLAHRARGSDVVVSFREQEARLLIASPIVGRAICRRSQLGAGEMQQGDSNRGTLVE